MRLQPNANTIQHKTKKTEIKGVSFALTDFMKQNKLLLVQTTLTLSRTMVGRIGLHVSFKKT